MITGTSKMPVLARFDVVRSIGQGAAGLVFEAIDLSRNERVALKTLRAVDGDALLQLKSEFRALQDIEHENLIRLGELIRDRDTWFFTMELVEGATFHAYVTHAEAAASPLHSTMRSSPEDESREGASSGVTARAIRFDDVRLRDALTQLARGLSALHAAGKVHRDIKPSNVLVTGAGRVVILDLGLARDSASNAEDYVVGTALYMAPEQIAGDAIDPACDWYSVGVVLYLCLTGRHPFEGSANDVMREKQRGDPPPPSALVDDVPPDLDALCMDLLQRDPSARPSGAAILARLEGERPSASTRRIVTHSKSRVFVGRSAELDRLGDAFEDVRKGGTVTVVVEGESGLGKTALVRRFARTRGESVRNLLVLSARCYERESVPYKAVDGLIDSLSEFLSSLPEEEASALLPRDRALLAHVFPILERGEASPSRASSIPPLANLAPAQQDGRARLFAAVHELFIHLAKRWPLLLLVDDLQWADADSLLLLSEVLRSPNAPSLLLLVTARAGARDAEGAPFGLPGDVRVVSLPRLTKEEGLALTERLLETRQMPLEASLVATIASEAAGHPLFVDELVRHAELEGGSTLAIGALDDALRARVAQLDSGASRLLEILAVAGVALRQETAMRAASLLLGEFAIHARTLRVGHLVRTSGARDDDSIETYHDRVREAVVARLTEPAKRAHHEHLARALEMDLREDPDALATHWLAAGDPTRALAYMKKAADQAYRALAFDRAARLYQNVLALPSLDAQDRQHAFLRLGESLGNIGRGVEAAHAFERAAIGADDDTALDLRRRAAEQLLNAGRFDEGDAALRSVLGAVGLRMPPSPLAALFGLLFARFLLWIRGLAFEERALAEVRPRELTRLDACGGVAELLGVVDTIRAAHFQSKTLLLALKAGEPSRLARALALEALFESSGGRKNTPRATRVFVRAEAMAARCSPFTRGSVIGARAFSRFLQGDFEAALHSSEHAGEILREEAVGTFWHARMAQLIPIWSLSWMGDLGVLAEQVDLRVRQADARGDLYAATCLRVGPPSLVLLRTDDPEGARKIVDDAMGQWTQRGYHNQHYWKLLATAQIDLYEGAGKTALNRVTREWPRMRRSLMFEVEIIRVEATFLRARATLAAAMDAPVNSSERAKLLRAASRDARAIARCGAAYSSGLAHIVRGAIASLGGNRDSARDHLMQAIEICESAHMRLHAYVARYRLGQLEDDAKGLPLVAAAEEWMKRQGIANVANMARTIAPGFEPRR